MKNFIFSLVIFSGVLLIGCSSEPTTAHQTLGGKIDYTYIGNSSKSVIIFQAGLGDDKSTWSTIINGLKDSHKVFTYDRPGYGDSTSSSMPRDACTIATELRSLLKAENINPPYLLVGHSIGGLYQYAFARLYPNDVAGLVLLDPTHPKHWQRIKKDDPASAKIITFLRATLFSKVMRSEFDDQEKCLERLDALQPINKPVRLLTRSSFSLGEKGAFEKIVRSLELEWKSLLNANQIEQIENSGHYIYRDQPNKVIKIIKEASTEAK